MTTKEMNISVAKICGFPEPFYSVKDIKFGGKNPGTAIWTLPKYTEDLNSVQDARKLLTTQQLKVKYLNNLREIVSRRMPKNKVGKTLISDYDLIDARAEEHTEALVKTFGLYK